MGRGAVRIVFYAINGSGLGHLTRLLAIARATRELLVAMDLGSDIRILTTSEASGCGWDFPTYKLPSHLVMGESGLSREAYLADSRLLTINLVASLHPDLLVTDTQPQGAFGEAALLRGHAAAMVFIDRHKDPSVATSELHQTQLPLYERILVPDEADQAARYPLKSELAERRRFTGVVQSFDGTRALGRDEVRDYFGVRPERRLVLLSAGGGGDGRAVLAHLIRALADDPRNHLLVGYGPLHRGGCVYRENVTPLQEADSWRYFRGLDAAVSAAGYNSYHELLAADVPTAFYAQPKAMDRQDERVRLGAERRHHAALLGDISTLEGAYLRARVDELIQSRFEPWNDAQGALRAAVEILALHPSMPRGRLFWTAHARRCYRGTDFVPALKALRAWREAAVQASARAEDEERAAAAWASGTSIPVDVAWGARLAALGDPSDVARTWCRNGTGEEARRLALGDLMACLEEHVPAESRDLPFRTALARGPESAARLVAALDEPGADPGAVIDDWSEP